MAHKTRLENDLAGVTSYVPKTPVLKDQWAGIVWPTSPNALHDPETGVDLDILKEVGKSSVAVTDDFVSQICLKSNSYLLVELYLGNSSSSAETC
jgi:hypothetical protein